MLARRVVTRPATAWRGFQLQRRFIHPSRSQLQALPLLDSTGKYQRRPRSKLIITSGLGGFILGCWLLFQIINYGIKNLEDHLQAKMSSIQQTDNTYDSVNFDDPISTISYFAKLCQPYTRRSEEELNQRFKGMMTQIIKTKDGSTKSAEVQVQHIMRSAAEKIHVAFREFNRDSIAITAKLVTLVIEEACKSLLDLMDDRVDVDYSSPYWKLLSG